MTESWKSNPMHWCDVCKCWLNDSKQARLNHERGMGHKENLARRIREMARKADEEKRSKEAAAASLKRIEDQAAKKFEADKKAAEAATGKWTWDESCSYYYNDKFRWYYDPKTKWYYGGEPAPEWSQNPPLPDNARFGNAAHEGGPVPQASTGTPNQGAGTAKTGSSTATAGAGAAGAKVITKVIALPKHPLSNIGGDQMPTVGRVGAAKGISLHGPATTAAAASGTAAGDKRKRDEGPLDPAEAEARAKREAARQRVAERTARSFGYL